MSSFSFAKLAEVGKVIAIACTPDGSIVGVNDVEGQVWFYAVGDDEPGELRPLPLRFTTADALAVLLHPDGRVISYRRDDALRIRIDDPRTGTRLRELVLGGVDELEHDEDYEPDEDDEPDEDYERPSVEDGYYFDVALLQRPPLLDWLQPLEIANYDRQSPIDWMATLPDELRYADMYPDRLTRLALHPNGRWLAVLDRDTRIIDLDSGATVCRLGYTIDVAAMLESGEGTHTIGFDPRGVLKVASVAISGNPFLEVDRSDPESGEHESMVENWRQSWRSAEHDEIEVHVYDPTSHLPPERIPEDTYKVTFRRRAIELWSRAGLQRSVFFPARACVIPSFDPGGFCVDPRALLITNESVELLELVTGERSPRHPPIGEPRDTSVLNHIGFDPARRRVLLWRDHVALLAAPIDEDRWGVCELPEGRRMREWAFASEVGRAFVLDDAGDLWSGTVDPEPGPSPSRKPSLQPLERELLSHPHEPAAFLVYADALIERGDPRGELIMLQHQGASDEALALIERHAEALLGPLAELDRACFQLGWERGYVRSAELEITYDALGSVLAFLGSESARLLESLALRLRQRSQADDVQATYANIDRYLAAARHLPLLRSRQLGPPGK